MGGVLISLQFESMSSSRGYAGSFHTAFSLIRDVSDVSVSYSLRLR
jgi:hypothetical protein